MKQAPLPLDHKDLVMLVRQHEFFGRAVDEIGDHAVDGAAVALDEDPGLARGHELGVGAPPLQALHDLHAGDHLAKATVVGHGVDPQTAFADALALGHVALVVLADVHEPRARSPRRGGEFGIVAQEVVQSGHDVQAPASSTIGRHDGGLVPPGGAIPIRMKDERPTRGQPTSPDTNDQGCGPTRQECFACYFILHPSHFIIHLDPAQFPAHGIDGLGVDRRQPAPGAGDQRKVGQLADATGDPLGQFVKARDGRFAE